MLELNQCQSVFVLWRLAGCRLWLFILRKEALRKSKLRDGQMMTENFKYQENISKMKISQSRTNFQMRSKMLDIKFNYSAKYEKDLWLCDTCCSAIETQSHMVFCPAYASFREGKDLKSDDDLIAYVQNVMKVRTKLNLKKWEIWWPHVVAALASSQVMVEVSPVA